jgi:hypothetical protein
LPRDSIVAFKKSEVNSVVTSILKIANRTTRTECPQPKNR